MYATTTLKKLTLKEAMLEIEAGAAFLDVRPVREYLDVHIPGSLENLYESGPGFAGRARDCIPLGVPLVLIETGAGVPLVAAAAALRGKGFMVLGFVEDALNAWAEAKGTPVSTDVIEGLEASGKLLLDVGDPGAIRVEGAVHIPADRLWARIDEVTDDAAGEKVVVIAGFGVRAALCIGILERHGFTEITYWTVG